MENNIGMRKEQIHQYPLCIEVELTNRCSLNCVMCGTPYMTRQKCDMAWDLFTKVVDDAVRNGYRVMWLHVFGEPLLYPRIFDAVRYIKEADKRGPCISTNGMLLTKDVSEQLIDSGVEHIMVVLSSMMKEVYEKIRVGAVFETVVENIHDLIDVSRGRIDIVIQHLITKWNANETADEYYREFGRHKRFSVTDWQTVRLPPHGEYIGLTKPHYGCLMRMVHFCVLADGRVPICCFDYDCTVCCGDMNIQTIDEVATGKLFEQYTYKILTGDVAEMPSCRKCYEKT